MANEEVLELQIRDNAADAASGLLSLSTALEKVKDAVGKGLRLKGVATQLETLKNAVNSGLDETSVARFERLAAVLEQLKGIGALKISGIKNIANQLNVAETLADVQQQAQDAASGIADAVDRGMEEVESRAISTGGSIRESFGNAREWIKDTWENLKGVVRASAEKPGGFLKELGQGIKNVRSGIGGMLSDFGRIVKYRMIRSVIKQITEAFTTGVKNVYNYSKAIGSSFAPAMDDAASILLQFKNSIGAAVAPLIESLLPVLRQVVEWAIEAFNYMNMFLALLRGQSTWTKAIYKATDAFDDQKKKAKGAKSAIKDLLADWDELNIIQSETGGSGHGAAKAAEDYTKMFEEENKFNDFLYNHFQDVLEYIKAAGVALLGWKLSKNFSGVLGKLFKLVAGGALVALGVKLSFDAGYDAGMNGFNSGNILRIIGGAIAAGLGGFLITSTIGLGGGIGLAIGLGVAVVATLVGYIKGQEDLKDKNKWGNLTWTKDQIERFVKDQFTFNVMASVTLLDGAIANERDARDALNAQIEAFKKSLTDANIEASININSDETSTAIQAAAAQGRKAIEAVNNLINKSGEGLDVLLKSFSFTNADGEDITKELLQSIKIADTTVEKYFEGIGDQLASLIEKGEHEHWKNADTKQAVLDLMERERKILDEAEKYKAEMQLDTSIRAGMSSVIDRQTANEVLEEQKKQLDEYEAKAMELFQEQANNYDYLAGVAMSAAKDARDTGTPEGLKAAEELEAAATEYHNRALEILGGAKEKISAKLEETKKGMASMWAETLQTVYGGDFKQSMDKYFTFDSNTGIFNNNVLQDLMRKKDYGGAGKELKESLITMLTADDPNGIVSYVLNDLQGNVFDLLTDEMRASLFKNLMGLANDNTKVVEQILKEAFGLDEKAVQELYNIPPDVFEDAWHDVTEDVDLDLNATVHLETDADKFRQDLKDELEYAIWDGHLSAEEEAALRRRFSDAMFEDMLDEMGIIVDKYGHVGGNAQLAPVNAYTPVPANITQTGEFGTNRNDIENDAKIYEKIESGVRNGNEPQNAILGNILAELVRSNNRPVNVNVIPSSGWGGFNSKSNDAYQKVTG